MEKLPPQPPSNSGQAVLIILLIMAVALTISLSAISRSITDIRISQQTEEAARAYSAAEAGIESALVGGALQGTFPETGASYQTATAGLAEGATVFVFPQELTPDELQTVWLVNHDAAGNPAETAFYTAKTLEVCWEGGAALEVGMYFKSGNDYKLARLTADPDSTRRNKNKFSSSDSGSCAGLANKKTLDFSQLGSRPTLLFLRLRVFYSGAKVGVQTPGGSGGVLPSQGVQVSSVGQAGGAVRKVEVAKFYPEPPAFLDFVLYSEGGLTK